MKGKIAYIYLNSYKLNRIKNSLKKRFDIKGDLRDLLNPYFLIKSFYLTRYCRVTLDIEKFEQIFLMISKDINNEKAILLASPIWKSSLKAKLNKISSLLIEKKFIELKKIYEDLFLDDLMEGAVSHQNSISLISKISQTTRFFSRSRKLLKIKENFDKDLILSLNNIIYSKNFNFGRPFAFKIHYLTNIESLDEQFFALKITELIKNNCYQEIVFIGDGAGFLAPLLIEINNFYHENNNCRYRIIDFLYFAISSYLRIKKSNNSIIINLPETLHKYEAGTIDPKNLPNINGKRLIVNQDSFPEMKKESIVSYTKNTASSTDIASYNQIPQNLDDSFADYLNILKDLNYKLLSIDKSPIRENYYVSFHTIRSC